MLNAISSRRAKLADGCAISDEDLLAYEMAIERAAGECQQRESQIFSNKSPQLGTITIKHLIRSCHSELRILTGSLNAGFYGSSGIVNEFISFLNRGGNAYILVDWQPAYERKTLADFCEANPLLQKAKAQRAAVSNLSILFVPESVVDRYNYHLIIADKHSFRFETDRRKTDSLAQFGALDLATNFAKRFDEIWRLCEDKK